MGLSGWASDYARQANIGRDNYGPIFLAANAAPSVSSLAMLSAPYQLPPDMNDFTGRQDEIRVLLELLTPAHHRLTVAAISGKPGVGKSALAIHVARRLAQYFPDGLLYVDLRGVQHPLHSYDVFSRFLAALGANPDQPNLALAGLDAGYRSLLETRRVLILLDNARNETQVRPLLAGGDSCAVIVTSRVPLASLEGAHLLALDVLPDSDSVDFLVRVGGRRATTEDASLQAIARDCGYLPLALRIAGGILRKRPHWNRARLAAQLADERTRLNRLTAGDLDVRSSFAITYRDLDSHLARAFRLLGTLPGRAFDVRTAAVLLECEEDSAEETIELLVEEQLVEPNPIAGGYRLHDLLRLFAQERAEQEETPASLDRARQHVARLMSQQFEANYRASLSDLAVHVLPMFDTVQRVPLDRLYVDLPIVEITPGRSVGTQDRELFTSSLKHSRRVVLFGGPGAGKTIAVARLALELARDGATPFVVALRDLAVLGEVSLVEYLVSSVQANPPSTVSAAIIQDIFRGGRAYLLLDGLDEVLHSEQRAHVLERISSIIVGFPKVGMIITSRPVGNRILFEALNEFGFAYFELLPLSGEMARTFAEKCLETVGNTEGANASARIGAESFFNEASALGSLTQTPLLLALMLSQYRREHFLARDRIDLYEKTMSVLFDRWDRARGIGLEGVAAERYDRVVLNEMAWWLQLSVDRRATPQPEGVLRDHVMSFMGSFVGEGMESAELARRFLARLVARGSLLVDVGVTPGGARLYSFAHRSLQEYCVALHLAASGSPREVATAIAGHLEDAGLNEVVLFAIEIQDRHISGGGQAVLRELISSTTNGSRERVSEIVRLAMQRIGLRAKVRSELTAWCNEAGGRNVGDAE